MSLCCVMMFCGCGYLYIPFCVARVHILWLQFLIVWLRSSTTQFYSFCMSASCVALVVQLSQLLLVPSKHLLYPGRGDHLCYTLPLLVCMLLPPAAASKTLWRFPYYSYMEDMNSIIIIIVVCSFHFSLHFYGYIFVFFSLYYFLYQRYFVWIL